MGSSFGSYGFGSGTGGSGYGSGSAGNFAGYNGCSAYGAPTGPSMSGYNGCGNPLCEVHGPYAYFNGSKVTGGNHYGRSPRRVSSSYYEGPFIAKIFGTIILIILSPIIIPFVCIRGWAQDIKMIRKPAPMTRMRDWYIDDPLKP